MLLVTSLKKEKGNNLNQKLLQKFNEAEKFALQLQKYLNCSQEMQGHAQEMAEQVVDMANDEDERFSAAMTLLEILNLSEPSKER